ncbi:MAG: DUF4407 domain-containing protein [Bacteroidales bacterium]|nr:DUF4407 domain-containing protein [Bacteroidales bacterium]
MGSRFQRFLWGVAGAELDILEKCRTDHKRFAAIGATILMTTFIAFCAGTSAAWYFTQSGDETSGSLGWAMVFGLIWALLIFCIDRSLVITLKKDPSAKRQKFWIPLLSRSALACIIAFMVSIPLELVVFEDFIAEQKFFFDESSAKDLSESTRAHREEEILSGEIDLSTSTMSRLDSLNTGLRGNVSRLNAQIQAERNKLNKPTSGAYITAQRQYNNYNSQITTAQRNLTNATTAIDSARYTSEISRLKDQRRPYWQTMDREKKAWNEKVNQKIKELEGERSIAEGQITQNASDYAREADRLARNRDTRDSLATERDKIVQDFRETSNKGNHFIQNYRILEYAVWQRDANGKLPTELFFLWMIRVLFFIIEILPTVVKIVTPVGSYDRMVQAEEKQVLVYLESDEYIERIRNMHDIELRSREEQLQKQHQIELELKSSILEKVKNAQIEVADATIAKWKENEMSKIAPKPEEPESEDKNIS